MNSHHGISKRDFAVGLVIVLLISLACFAFVFSKVDSLSKPNDYSAKFTAIEQRLAAVEEKVKPPAVKLRLLYDSTDKFAEPALAEVASAQAALAQQGLVIELEDVSGHLTEVRKLGFSSLPVLYLPESEAIKNPTLYQAMQSQSRADAGYRINALGFITTSKTMIDLECKPGNSSARLLQFAQFDCPNCAAMQSEVAKVLSEFAGKLEYRFRHYPTPDAPLSQNASEAVVCAGKQNKSSEFAAKLFATVSAPGEWRLDTLNNTRDIDSSVEVFKNYSRALGLNESEFSSCLQSPVPGVEVEQDITEGVVTYDFQKKVQYFPAFVIDCKGVFIPSSAQELKDAVCRARPELCGVSVSAIPVASASPVGNSTNATG